MPYLPSKKILSAEITLTMALVLYTILWATAQGSPLEITLNNQRGQRFCELIELNFPISAIAWSSLTQHDCPQQVWDDVKAGVNPAEYFPIDTR